MNVEIENEALQFLCWEHLFRIFSIAALQCDGRIKGVDHWDKSRKCLGLYILRLVPSASWLRHMLRSGFKIQKAIFLAESWTVFDRKLNIVQSRTGTGHKHIDVELFVGASRIDHLCARFVPWQLYGGEGGETVVFIGVANWPHGGAWTCNSWE